MEAAVLIRTIDFETTGMPPDAAVCEVGWADVDTAATHAEPIGFEALICDPGRPMPPEARAIHHLSDADCAFGLPVTTAFRRLMDGADVFCAHNAEFERQFFAGGERPWICTLKVARRIWPECPSHSNQCLRYWLGLELDDALAMPPHRAGPDAYVTACILVRALNLATVDDMAKWTAEPSLLPRVTFGKHRNSAWADLPTDYLSWIVDKSDMDRDTKFTARHWLKQRRERA